jgi:hypothetical protein
MTIARAIVGLTGLLALSPALAARQAEPPAPPAAADAPEKSAKPAAPAPAKGGGLSLEACRTKVLNAKEKAHCCQTYPSELKCG